MDAQTAICLGAGAGLRQSLIVTFTEITLLIQTDRP